MRDNWQGFVFENIADLNEQAIYNVIRRGIHGGRMPEHAIDEPVESILARWNLIKDGVPVNGAYALFAGKSNLFPQLGLRLARFRGTDMHEFIDSKWESGNIFELLDAGMAFCFKHLNLSGKIKGLLREEELDIPVDALREALMNCFCHRRYDYPNETAQLAIYDDRVEIANPGHFPAGITPQNIKSLHVSKPRNMKIAQVLYKGTYIENWGSGIQRMIDTCLKQGLPEPEYNLWADGTIVIVFRKKMTEEISITQRMKSIANVTANVTEKLPKNEERVISLLRANSYVTQSMMAEKLGLTRRQIARILHNFYERNIIKRIGPDNGGHWEIINVTEHVTENVIEHVTEHVTEKLTANELRIISLIHANSYITQNQMAEHLGLTRRQVARLLHNLHERDIIRRIGPAKGGHWEVNNGDPHSD